MEASLLPSIFVPIIGLIFPIISMGFFFVFVSSQEIEEW